MRRTLRVTAPELILLLLVLFLVSPPPSSGQDGGTPDACDGGPLETRSVLRCRDGDPTCDMDGMCDGTCFVRSCVIYPKNPASCLVTTRFCARTARPTVGWWLIPVGDKQTSRWHATLVGAVCKPARRGCVAPTLRPCRVEVTGDVTASFSCQARLITTASQRSAIPKYPIILLSEVGGSRSLQIQIDDADLPGPGTLTSDLPDRRVSTLTVNTESESIYADNRNRYYELRLDASLALSTVGVSKSPYHEAHGMFDATGVGIGVHDPQATRRALVVHAEF
jgi:hypothetical protein